MKPPLTEKDLDKIESQNLNGIPVMRSDIQRMLNEIREHRLARSKDALRRMQQDAEEAGLYDEIPPGSDCVCGRYQDESHRPDCPRFHPYGWTNADQ